MGEMALPIDSFSLGCKELENSPLASKLSDVQRKQYVTAALEAGKDAANLQLKSADSIFHLIERTPKINLVLKDNKKSSVSALRGEINYKKKQCTITVYQDSVHSLFEDYKDSLPPQFRLTEKQALAVHLAHEYFHYLEFESGQTVSEQLPKAEVPSLFRFKQHVEVTVCSEIAAHAFAKQFCHLSVLPNYYDLHFLLCRSRTAKI